MKKLLLTMTGILVCVGAFGQGVFNFSIGSDNLMYFTTDTTKLLGTDATILADNGYGGGPVLLPGSTLYVGDGLNATPGTIAQLSTPTTFVVSLWYGSSSSSLAMVPALNGGTSPVGDANGIPGGIPGGEVTLPNGFPANTPVWLQVQVYDATYNSAAAAWAAGHYAGESVVFQATPTVSPGLPIGSSAVSSTWPSGSIKGFIPTDLVFNSTPEGGDLFFYGGIEVYAGAVPEPGTFALAGMGLAALLVFRRRS
jgi:hypothetical protein